jgi:hypothetical protein
MNGSSLLIIDLPDFRSARNLFSVGFDDVGLFLLERGLEGVLREITEVRHLAFEAKGKTIPATEADFYDLIEVIWQVRWKTKGTACCESARDRASRYGDSKAHVEGCRNGASQIRHHAHKENMVTGMRPTY